MATVPDTTTFSLQDVVNVVGGSSLSAAFDNSVDGAFDSTYKESKNQLDDFRNYDDAYSAGWNGYIVWSLSSFDGTTLYFTAYNQSTVRNGISSNMDWETRLAGTPVSSGTVGSGGLNAGNYGYPTAGWTGVFDSVWGKSGGGAFIQLY